MHSDASRSRKCPSNQLLPAPISARCCRGFENIYIPIKAMLASGDFLQQADRSDIDFCRQRVLPRGLLVPLLLNLRKGTVREALDQCFKTLAGDAVPLNAVSAAFLRRARQKLKPEALAMLNGALVDSEDAQIAQARWRDFRVLAVDGSTACLPNTLAISEYFGGPYGNGEPLARFCCFFTG
jgi:hypothetical protein